MVVGLVGVFCQAVSRPSLSKLSTAPVGLPLQVFVPSAARQADYPFAKYYNVYERMLHAGVGSSTRGAARECERK